METRATFLPIAAEKRPAPFVVGVAGATGAGKTCMARALAERFRDIGCCLIDQDSYYLDRSRLSEKERQAVNFDEPAALDHDLLLSHLGVLLGGKVVEKPIYDFRTHTRTRAFQLLEPAPLIILEGIYAFWDARIAALMGLKVYIDAEQDVRFIRRLRRDVVERGRSVESTITQYLDTVRPMQRLHIEPTKYTADLVVDTSDSFAKPVAEVIRAVSERYLPAKPSNFLAPASPKAPPRFRGKPARATRLAR